MQEREDRTLKNVHLSRTKLNGFQIEKRSTMNVLRFLLVASILLSMAACGGCGGTSQSTLRKVAGRKRGDDESRAVAPKPPDTSKGEDAKGIPAAPADGKPAAQPQLQNNNAQEPTKTVASNERPTGPLTEVERRARS